MLGAGAVGGAVVLLGIAVAWLTGMIPERDDGTAAVAARLAAVELQVRDLAARGPATGDATPIGDLSARVSKLEAAPAGQDSSGSDPALANRLGALEAAVKPLADQVAGLNRRTDALANAAREARERADAATKALAGVVQGSAEQTHAAAAEKAQLDQLANRIVALETATKSLQAAAENLAKRSAAQSGDRAARLAVLAAALKSAVERGVPFASELAALKPLVADPKILDPLEPFAASGVPGAAALSRELAALAPGLLRASDGPSKERGLLDRLQANAERLVRIRPVRAVAGDDAAAVIARIEIKAEHADVSGALAELAKLPASARAPAEGWIKKAQALDAALAAARRVAAEAFAALGQP